MTKFPKNVEPEDAHSELPGFPLGADFVIPLHPTPACPQQPDKKLSESPQVFADSSHFVIVHSCSGRRSTGPSAQSLYIQEHPLAQVSILQPPPHWQSFVHFGMLQSPPEHLQSPVHESILQFPPEQSAFVVTELMSQLPPLQVAFAVALLILQLPPLQVQPDLHGPISVQSPPLQVQFSVHLGILQLPPEQWQFSVHLGILQ